MFRCFTISALLHCGLIVGLLILSFLAPPMKKQKIMTIDLTMGIPGLPPGAPGPKGPGGGAPKAAAPAPAPEKKEAPAPTPAPSPAATPKAQSTPKPAPTAAPTPQAAKPPIVKPTKTPTPTKTATPPKTVASKPTTERKILKAEPTTNKKVITRPNKNKKLVEVQHTPKPTPTPKATPEPKVEEIDGSVGDAPESNEKQVAMADPAPGPAVPAVPDVPDVPPVPAGTPPPVTGPGGTGTGVQANPNAITGEIGGSGTGTGPGGGGGGGGGGSILSEYELTYFLNVRNRIEENFNLPYSRPGEKCQIQFVIQKDGTISNIQILQKSNYDNLDHLAVQALELTKVPPIYDGLQVNSLTIILTFNFEKKM